MSDNFTEIKARNAGELLRELQEKREQLRRSRFELASGRMKNIRTIRETRRAIAQLLTALAQKKESR